MTLLELVKELAAESGTASPGEITDVTAPANDHINDLIRWIRRANYEVTAMRDDWRFRIEEGEFETTVGESQYDVTQFIENFQKLWFYRQPYQFRYITADLSGSPVTYVPYHHWHGKYDVLQPKTGWGRPQYITLDPKGVLRLYPTPADSYIIGFDYIRKPQMMTLSNTCESIIPERYHNVILYYALLHYAFYDEAQAKIQTASVQYRRAFMTMANDQLPEVRVV